MTKQPLTRKEKEALAIINSGKLERWWGHEVQDSDFRGVDTMTDEELDEFLETVSGQRKFEIKYEILTSIIAVAIGIGIIAIFG